MTHREKELTDALRAITQKLLEVHEHPAYQAVWQLAMIHGMTYKGPQYETELKQALEVLQRPTPPEDFFLKDTNA